MTETNWQKSSVNWAHAIGAVAFDMDGLMVNTEDLYTEVSEVILERRGRKFTPDLKRSMMGLPGNKAFALMIERESLQDTVEVLAAETEEIFEALLPRKLQVLPGLLELLAELDHRRLPRCVATSSTRQFAAKVLRTAKLSEHIDFVITAEDVVNGKPAPDIYLAAAERMCVSAPCMLVLEDSQHGTSAGVASGACTVAVPGHHSADHDFSGAHFVASTLLDPKIRSLF